MSEDSDKKRTSQAADARAGQSVPPALRAAEAPRVDEEPARASAAGAIDQPRAEAAVRELLIAIGEDPDRDGLRDTPGRVARAYEEFFAGLSQTPEDVLSAVFELGHEEMILVKDIELYSMCEHHLVPFHGVAHVAYIPGEDGRITGLSKLARLVEMYARRPQVQERLTTQVADALVEHLGARGVIVVVEAEHLCMSMRGIRKPGSRTVTSAVRGVMRDGATRAEAMSLIVGK
ncbi:GTP cyclohydrolase I FolE [Demequina sp. SO4-18]|uniref:GTP cyclohydrolase I FolE n=1 Tax=Demequina sp. SO4-18 TaxID=3401026 RepID=UPI003B59EF78